MSATPADPFYQRGLTGLRALAATWVMLFHLNGLAGPRAMGIEAFGTTFYLHPLLTCGWVGVDIFFVLSGFLLATHLLDAMARRREHALRRYFIARARRVFPAYWAQLAILLAIGAWLVQGWPAWAHYLPLHIPMLHFVSQPASWAINDVYWTLPIELSFYLVLPLVARILARAEAAGGAGRWRVLAAIWAASVLLVLVYRSWAYRAYAGGDVDQVIWATSQLPGTFDQFMAGVAAATILRWRRLEGRPLAGGLPSTLLALFGLAGMVMMIYVADRYYLVFWKGHWTLFAWHSITAIFVALLVAGIALGGGLTRALFENRAVFWIGTVSYSLYLWHNPLLRALKPWLDAAGGGLAIYLIGAVPVILAVSALSYYAVERPFSASHRRGG